MEARAFFTVVSRRTVTDTCAPAPTAAAMVGRPWNAESARIRTCPCAPAPRKAFTVFNASATRRFAPRTDPQEPLRSRCATMTGAAAEVVTVASSTFSPRTPE
ncbi:hypothetical protein GCM10023317_26010 [Actinopolymorpha pittospori]